MANPSVQMSEETKKFQEAISEYFNYNKYGFTPEKGYSLLFLLYLVKNNALQVINSNELSRNDKSKLKIFLCYPFKNIFKDLSNVSEEYKRLATCDCIVINLPKKEAEIQEIADGLGLNLDYNYHKDYININLVATWARLIQISPLWYEENSLWAFKEIYKRIESLMSYGEIRQPEEVTALTQKLLDTKEGMVYNPYANIDYVLDSMEREEEVYYFHHTINSLQSALIRLAYLIKDGEFGYAITNSDPITDWKGENGFDYITATPPWGIKSFDSEFPSMQLDYLARSSRDAQHKSIGVYSTSVCYEFSSKPIVKELVDNDWLETVIILPNKIFHRTTLDSVVIVVNKKKDFPGYVRFLDASTFYNTQGHQNILDVERVLSGLKDNEYSKIISNKEISNCDYNLYPRLYSARNNDEFPKNYHVVELETILEPCNGERRFSETEGRLVMISDLSNNSLESLLNLEDIKVTNNLNRAIKITEPVFLFSKIRELKPSYCFASKESPIFIHPNVFAYKLGKNVNWVDYQYLCYELDRRSKDIAVGVIPNISKSILSKIKVGFPSEDIEVQKLVVKETVQQLKLGQAKEIGLQELIEGMKAEYMNEVRMRKHDMRPHLTNLSSVGRIMQAYINKFDAMPEMKKIFLGLIKEYQKSLDSLTNLVEVLSEEDKFGESEIIDINQYFKQLEESNDATISGYNLNYHIDINSLYESEILGEDCQDIGEHQNIPLYVDIARVDLERLITNIFEK